MPDDSPSVHKIRLAGPWNVESELDFSDQNDDAGNRYQIKMPASWQEIFGSQSGPAVFRRSFNSPTGLQGRKVFLVIPPTNGSGQLHLNNQLLGGFDDDTHDVEGDAVFEKKFEITQIIQPHNEIKIELTCQPEPHRKCGLCTEVILEISE